MAGRPAISSWAHLPPRLHWRRCACLSGRRRLQGERHGYAVAQEVEQLTEGRVRMGPGTLYGSIRRMEAAGLIEEPPPRARARLDEEERRRFYRLTRLGRRVLAAELERLERVVALARAKRLLRERPA